MLKISIKYRKCKEHKDILINKQKNQQKLSQNLVNILFLSNQLLITSYESVLSFYGNKVLNKCGFYSIILIMFM